MRDKKFFNLNYIPKTEADLAAVRKMLKDHCIGNSLGIRTTVWH